MLTKRWIVCRESDHHAPKVVELVGDETKMLFNVYEKNNKEHWNAIKWCLRFKSRLSKTDARLFESKNAAIDSYIASLEESRKEHLRRAEEIVEHIKQLREQRDP
jgi:hypothetical protein